jgi:hypothetical protein
MLSLFYSVKVAQNGGSRYHCMFCTAWLCYAELLERFPAFPGWFQLLLQFLPQDHVVSPLESRTPGFACTSGVKSGERGGQVTGPPRPIHLLPKVSSKHSLTTLVQCAGAPSYSTHISRGLAKAPLPAARVRSLGEIFGKCHQ